jgi:hypothetical protein
VVRQWRSASSLGAARRSPGDRAGRASRKRPQASGAGTERGRRCDAKLFQHCSLAARGADLHQVGGRVLVADERDPSHLPRDKDFVLFRRSSDGATCPRQTGRTRYRAIRRPAPSGSAQTLAAATARRARQRVPQGCITRVRLPRLPSPDPPADAKPGRAVREDTVTSARARTRPSHARRD